MTRRQPSLELDRLLDALSEEVIAATDDEVRQAHRSFAVTAGEVSRLIEAARADAEERSGEAVDADLRARRSGRQLTRASRRLSHHQH